MNQLAPTALEDPASGARTRVGYLVYRVERRLRSRLDQVTRTQGVTTTEYVTLSVLRRHDGMSGAELARWAFVSPQAMNLVVSALQRRGLVKRWADPQHRRILRTTVTPKGLGVLDRCDSAMDLIEADMLRDMGPESVESLHEMLASCARSLEATRPRPPL